MSILAHADLDRAVVAVRGKRGSGWADMSETTALAIVLRLTFRNLADVDVARSLKFSTAIALICLGDPAR